MAGKHDVYILEVDGEYRARPAVAAVEHGNGITFRNLTPYPVKLSFPAGLLKKFPLSAVQMQALPRGMSAFVAQLLQNTRILDPNSQNKNFKFAHNANGAFSYQADVQEPTGPVPVVGESGPKIIVDP